MILGKKEIEKRLTFDYKEFHDDELDEKQIYIKVPDETIADGIESFKKMYIGNDSIDLHISDKFFKMNSKLKYINTLSFDPDECFEEVKFDIYNGYTLKPGEIIFIGTIEQIQLKGNIIGRVVGRSTFARLGLSIHCTQEKFSTGINSIVPLQIVNHAPVPLKIFPKSQPKPISPEEAKQLRLANLYSRIYDNPCAETLKLITKPDQTFEIVKAVLQADGLVLNDVYKRLVTYELCLIAVKQNGLALECVVNKYPVFLSDEIIEEAVKSNGLAIEFVSLDKISKKLARLAICQPINEKYRELYKYPIAFS